MDKIKYVFDNLKLYGDFLSAEPYGNGHINDTFKVMVSQGGIPVPYLLQRINHNIFTEPEKLMENVDRICSHQQSRLRQSGEAEPSRTGLTLIPSIEGKSYVKDGEGSYWRCYIFIEGALGYDIIESEEQAYEAARAFGSFQNLLSDLPGERLHETIADFHNTPVRFGRFRQAIEEDSFNLADSVRDEIDFFLSFENEISYFTDAVREGRMPERVTHNDTKLNNVLLDTHSGKAVCIIDLDTSMPGLAAYDFGDLVRTSTCTALEDEKDLSKVVFQKPMFEALVKGYLSTASSFLTEAEVRSLVYGGILMTYEVGMRFLTDYLSGSVYFKSRYPEHNLDRCRTQMTLVKALWERKVELEEFVWETYSRSGKKLVGAH